MESISVTTYRGFSTVNGETTLAQDMADIKNGKYARLIIKIASLVIQGKTEEANNVRNNCLSELSQQTIAKEGWHTALSATIRLSPSTSTNWKKIVWKPYGA